MWDAFRYYIRNTICIFHKCQSHQCNNLLNKPLEAWLDVERHRYFDSYQTLEWMHFRVPQPPPTTMLSWGTPRVVTSLTPSMMMSLWRPSPHATPTKYTEHYYTIWFPPCNITSWKNPFPHHSMKAVISRRRTLMRFLHLTGFIWCWMGQWIQWVAVLPSTGYSLLKAGKERSAAANPCRQTLPTCRISALKWHNCMTYSNI